MRKPIDRLRWLWQGLPLLTLVLGTGCVTSSKATYGRHLAATVEQSEPTMRVETIAFQRERDMDAHLTGAGAEVVLP